MRYKVRNKEFQEKLLLTTSLKSSSVKQGRWYSKPTDRGQYGRVLRYCGKVNLFVVGLFDGQSIKKSPLYQFYAEQSSTPIVDTVRGFMWSVPKPIN